MRMILNVITLCKGGVYEWLSKRIDAIKIG
ncbi:hypothetical protein PSP6_190034 [Paraburkholderia tropica]|nr:hypothetical protein PSP6_190034 [Paraburkholderia tropica]